MTFALGVGLIWGANEQNSGKYRRSSLYSILVNHPDEKMSDEIRDAFLELEVPDKFNDHNLSVRYVEMAGKLKEKELAVVDSFILHNQIAKRMVSKWFDRNKKDGSFDMKLLSDRGLYNASAIDADLAKLTIRGKNELADAGEELIGNTFLLINDVSYIDKQRNAEIAGTVISGIAQIAAAVIPGLGAIADLIKSAGELASSITKTIAGFTVKTTTYLYQMEWNDEVSGTFYSQYYFDPGNPNAAKKAAYEADSTLFKLKYIGKYSATSSKTVMRGLYEPSEVFRKVVARSLDKNIMELQKEFEVFRVKVPIIEVQGNIVKVSVGLKEGVSENSVYEVLETVIDGNGKTTYNRVGTIKAVKDRIWDNRYMATKEGASGSDLGYTTFEKVSATADFYPGMLVREIKF